MYLQGWKPSYSARLLHFSKLTTSKTQQFCETSSFIKVDNIKNQAILRDFLIVCTWQHQKRGNSVRLLHFLNLTTSKTKQFCELDNIKNKAILRNFLQKWKIECTNWRPRTKRFFQSICLKYCACHEKSDAKSYEVQPVTQNHLAKPQDLMLQNATPLRKSPPGLPNSSDETVSCTAPATENASLQILFKMSHACHPFSKCYKTLTFYSLLRRCTIPCACHAKRHLNVQKWQVVRNPCVFNILTSNVLRATTACTFSTSQLPKAAPSWCVLYIFTSKCASRHNGMQFFISHLARWLHTRRFSEPTFGPSGATNHGQNTVFRDFPTFSHICIFFLLTFSSLISGSSHLCFSSVHIVRSLTSKLPSFEHPVTINLTSGAGTSWPSGAGTGPGWSQPGSPCGVSGWWRHRKPYGTSSMGRSRSNVLGKLRIAGASPIFFMDEKTCFSYATKK